MGVLVYTAEQLQYRSSNRQWRTGASVQMTTVERRRMRRYVRMVSIVYAADHVTRRIMLGDGGSKLVKSWIREMADNTLLHGGHAPITSLVCI